MDRLLRTSEYRNLSPHEKAVKLWNDHKFVKHSIAMAVGLSDSAVQRAINADRDHRDPGRKGKPTVLNTGEEKEYIDSIQRKADEGELMTGERMADEVSFKLSRVFFQISIVSC